MKCLKTLLIALAATATALVLASPASAVAAKFHKVGASVTDSGGLVVSFDERGVGNGDIDYQLDATATATYACINGGGKNPSAANKRAYEASVSAAASFASKNGRVVATMTLDAPSAPDFECPKGQKRVLAGVTFSGIVLADVTNGSSVTIADATREFVKI